METPKIQSFFPEKGNLQGERPLGKPRIEFFPDATPYPFTIFAFI